MSIRETHILNDVQDCFYELLSRLAADTSPWTDWEIMRAFPQQDVNTDFAKPIIYIMKPVKSGEIGQQGGKPVFLWEMTVGVWIDRKAGNVDELGIMVSELLALFNDHNTCNKKTFAVILGKTEYSDTTLLNMGIQAAGVTGPRDAAESDLKEFRQEITIQLIA